MSPRLRLALGLPLIVLVVAFLTFTLVARANILLVAGPLLTLLSALLVTAHRRWPWALAAWFVVVALVVGVGVIPSVRYFSVAGPQLHLTQADSVPGPGIVLKDSQGINAYDREGVELWSQPGALRAIQLTDEVTLVEGPDRSLTAMGSDGEELWSVADELSVEARSGDVVVVARRGEDGTVLEGRRVDDGTAVWSLPGDVERDAMYVYDQLPASFIMDDSSIVRDAATGRPVGIDTADDAVWLLGDAVVTVADDSGPCIATVTHLSDPDHPVEAGEVVCGDDQARSAKAAGQTLLLETGSAVRLDASATRTWLDGPGFPQIGNDVVVWPTSAEISVEDATTGELLWQVTGDSFETYVGGDIVVVVDAQDRRMVGPFHYDMTVHDARTGAVLDSFPVSGSRCAVGDTWVVANTIDLNGVVTTRLLLFED